MKFGYSRKGSLWQEKLANWLIAIVVLIIVILIIIATKNKSLNIIDYLKSIRHLGS